MIFQRDLNCHLNLAGVEFAVDTRRGACSCSVLPQMPCNAVDAVKSTLATISVF